MGSKILSTSQPVPAQLGGLWGRGGTGACSQQWGEQLGVHGLPPAIHLHGMEKKMLFNIRCSSSEQKRQQSKALLLFPEINEFSSTAERNHNKRIKSKSCSLPCLKLTQICLPKINMQIPELTYCTEIGILHRFHILGVGVAPSQLYETGNAPVPGKHIPSGKQEPSYPISIISIIPQNPQNIPVKKGGASGNSREQNVAKEKEPRTAAERIITNK